MPQQYAVEMKYPVPSRQAIPAGMDYMESNTEPGFWGLAFEDFDGLTVVSMSIESENLHRAVVEATGHGYGVLRGCGIAEPPYPFEVRVVCLDRLFAALRDSEDEVAE